MKALLVVEDKSILNKLKQFLNRQGFDTICYQWIIKALDNIEEVSPHLVIISAKDYPRHWKTLVQYIKSCSLETEPAIILISNELSKDEGDKVVFLKIKTLINDVEQDKQQLIEALNELKPKTDNIENSIKSEQISEKLILQEDSINSVENTIKTETVIEPTIENEKQNVTTEIEPTIETETQAFTTEIVVESTIDTVIEPVVKKSTEPKPVLNEKNEYINPTPLENFAKWDSDTNIVQAVTEEKLITQTTINEIIKSENVEPKTETTKKQSTFTITHPVTHEEIFGKVESFKYPNLNFIPDDEKMFSVLRFGQIFNGCILKEFDENGTEEVSTHRAQIRGNVDNIIRFCLLK